MELGIDDRCWNDGELTSAETQRLAAAGECRVSLCHREHVRASRREPDGTR